MPDDKDRILALMRDQEAAIARGDADAVVAALAADVVVYDLRPPLAYRGDAARDADALRQWFATWTDGVSTQMHEPTILIDGDLAVVFGLSRMRGVKKDGGPIDRWDRRTIVLKRSADRWLVVHEHTSYPMRWMAAARR